MAVNAGVVREGSGDPATVFAAGGHGPGNFAWMRAWGEGVRGTHAFFPYGGVQPWLPGRPPGREAERDAAEARAVGDRFGATRAIGVSRGARALLGVLAQDPRLFERVVLVIPPGGTAAGRYREWLAGLPADAAGAATGATILILALRGDAAHPVSVARDWASRLGATLEVFPSLRTGNALDAMRGAVETFLNGSA